MPHNSSRRETKGLQMGLPNERHTSVVNGGCDPIKYFEWFRCGQRAFRKTL